MFIISIASADCKSNTSAVWKELAYTNGTIKVSMEYTLA